MRHSSYEALMVDRLDEVKALAASKIETYGDWSRIGEAIDDLLDEIRGYIKSSRNSVRRHRRDVEWSERHCRRYGSEPRAEELYRRFLASAEKRLAFECAMRDELKAGRSEMKRQDREERRMWKRLKPWLEREIARIDREAAHAKVQREQEETS